MTGERGTSCMRGLIGEVSFDIAIGVAVRVGDSVVAQMLCVSGTRLQ